MDDPKNATMTQRSLRRAPLLGEDRAVLLEAGFPEAEIETLQAWAALRVAG